MTDQPVIWHYGLMAEPWPEYVRPQIASDGSEHRAYFRILEVDPLEQTYTRQVRP